MENSITGERAPVRLQAFKNSSQRLARKRRCQSCNRAIPVKLRGDAHYCSARCRQREYRAHITTRGASALSPRTRPQSAASATMGGAQVNAGRSAALSPPVPECERDLAGEPAHAERTDGSRGHRAARNRMPETVGIGSPPMLAVRRSGGVMARSSELRRFARSIS